MTKRKMFLRMITASLLRRRSRMLIALLSIGIGATILSGLVTIYYDVPRQMGSQFRNYGANMILMPGEEAQLTLESAARAASAIPGDQLVGATPYRYVRLDMVKRQQSFTAAGTDFTQVQKTSPYFNVEGRYPENARELLVGKEIAEVIGVRVNSVMEVTYKPSASAEAADAKDLVAGAVLTGMQEGWGGGMVGVTVTLGEDAKIASCQVDASSQTEEFGGQYEKKAFTDTLVGKSIPLAAGDVDLISGATLTGEAVIGAINTAQRAASVQDAEAAAAARTLNFTVTGILDTGGQEESYVFMSMDDLSALTGEQGRLDVMELSVSAGAEELEGYVAAIRQENPDVTPRLVKRVTRSETAVLGKLQALVFLVTAVVLLLTMICVSTTMMAVVTERRREIGLRKALGASDNSIRAEFLGEGMFLGGLGGIMGALLGFVFAQVVSIHVFGSDIRFTFWLLPITIIVSMVIAALSCLLPIRRAVAVDPALVLKGE